MKSGDPSRRQIRWGYLILLSVICLGINIGLNKVNSLLSLPFFMDSIGTAILAAAGGLVPGLIVAVATNGVFELIDGFPGTHFPFALCGVATVLIVWAFVRRDAFNSIGSVLLASLAVAIANALLGGLIAGYVFDGITGVGVDYLVSGLVATGRSVFTAAFWARIPANLFDKTLAVLAAFFLRPVLVRWMERYPEPAASQQ